MYFSNQVNEEGTNNKKKLKNKQTSKQLSYIISFKTHPIEDIPK